MLDAKIASLRNEYTQAILDENSIVNNPISQFEKWWSDVLSAEVSEPNAFTLSTVDKNAKPHSRIVLLKSFDKNGFIFFTNYNSAKGKDIEFNKNVSILFFWKELERQIRIEGQIEKIDSSFSSEYFYSRPRESQIGAWTSNQSEEVNSRQELENKYSKLTSEFENKEIPFPEHWGGYIVEPQSIEFWQGRPSRLHDRIKYCKEGADWKIIRLQP